MKTAIKFSYASQIVGMAIVLTALMFNQGCKKDGNVAAADPADVTAIASGSEAAQVNPGKGYGVVNLVSDASQYSPAHIDANLVNAWGLAFGPTGGVWVSSAEKGLSAIYDQNGNMLRAPVNIGFGDLMNGAAPTGQVYNYTDVFMMPPMGPMTSALSDARVASALIKSKFIFATENGTIAAWAAGDNAVTVADRSSEGAVYKGIAIARDGLSWFLYATDFHNGKVDVFDKDFNYVASKQFTDANIPEGFAPFNIRRIGLNLVVTYAKQKGPENKDDDAAVGNGYVNIFRPSGRLVRRLASQGTLNSPWGIELLKRNMGFDIGENNPALGLADDKQSEMENDENGEIERPIFLIGNFGDGYINAFDRDGKYLGQLMSNGSPLKIEGLWALSYAPAGDLSYFSSRNRLYFTAGPGEEEHGVFGYITRAKVKG